jgi:hypothetical protein
MGIGGDSKRKALGKLGPRERNKIRNKSKSKELRMTQNFIS